MTTTEPITVRSVISEAALRQLTEDIWMTDVAGALGGECGDWEVSFPQLDNGYLDIEVLVTPADPERFLSAPVDPASPTDPPKDGRW